MQTVLKITCHTKQCNNALFTSIHINCKTIEPCAFQSCSSLTSITFSNVVKTIGDLAFYGCKYIDKIALSDSVETIGKLAFDGYFTSFTILKGVKSINPQFTHNSKEFTITIDEDNQFYSTYNGALMNKNQTELIWYPSFYAGTFATPNATLSIGEGAFMRRHYLTCVVLNEGLEYIGPYAFESCVKLENVTLPKTLNFIGE